MATIEEWLSVCDRLYAEGMGNVSAQLSASKKVDRGREE